MTAFPLPQPATTPTNPITNYHLPITPTPNPLDHLDLSTLTSYLTASPSLDTTLTNLIAHGHQVTEQNLLNFLHSPRCQTHLQTRQALTTFQATIFAQEESTHALNTLHEVSRQTQNPIAQRLAATHLLELANIHPSQKPHTIIEHVTRPSPAATVTQSSPAASPPAPQPSPPAPQSSPATPNVTPPFQSASPPPHNPNPNPNPNHFPRTPAPTPIPPTYPFPSNSSPLVTPSPLHLVTPSLLLLISLLALSLVIMLAPLQEISMGYLEELKYADLAARLNAIGQAHVFRFWHELSPDQQADFAKQLESLDWPLIDKLVKTVVVHPHKFELPGNVEPAPYYQNKPADPNAKQKLRDAFAKGEDLLNHGKIAAFVVAGGQGTRLGWPGPKGTFPATPVQHKSLFQCFAEFLLALGNRHGNPNGGIPFYIMTSPQNDQPTREFWRENNFFGMPQSNVMFFPQDELPAIAFDGKVLLQSKDSLALSPNGHGGSLLALWKSGAIADMKRRGITQISYFQVDNPIVRCIDPTFIGLHELDGAQMSSKMLPKAFPKEKLGNFALINGKMSVIEYSDLPDELAEQRIGGGPNGDLRFRAGSIALHAIRVDFVEELNKEGFALPFHRAEKKVPCIDADTGAEIKPDKPNAVKLETFVFDALPLTQKSIIYETDRLDEFAPIKQAQGVDSPATSEAIITQRNAQWLEAAGVKIPRRADGSVDGIIEIAPAFALYPSDLVGKVAGIKMAPGEKIYLG